MTTPAKEHFMDYLQATVDGIAYQCLMLSQDVPKFKNSYLTHAMKIITGMVDKVRVYLIVNRTLLTNSLPKGVKRHDRESKKKG